MNTMTREFWGEFTGTFILVFFGCGIVGLSITSVYFTLFDVAFVWCLGVTFGIYASRHLSGAHLNPAVTLAMLIAKKIKPKQLLPYLSGQFLGAFIAAAVLFFLLSPALEFVETGMEIQRGSKESIATAKMFGEYYPNGIAGEVTTMHAFFAEALGTFLLVFMIFVLCAKNNINSAMTPFYIGLTVAAIICLIAPITQAGLNPARDFAPRLFSYFAGWGDIVFTVSEFGCLLVYIAGPLVGGALAAVAYKFYPKAEA
jgi:glycerol uptake facilitator protein